MPEGNGETELEPAGASRWVVRSLYMALIAANLYLVFDWWKESPSGAATIERLGARLGALKAKAEGCEGCARRRAALRAAINRMHFEAIETLEAADVEAPEA